MIFLIEYALIVAAIYLAVSQIILPSVKGRKWFPMFRTEAELLAEYTEVTQAEYEETIRRKVAIKKENLNNLKGEDNAE
jgi:hypothetical protein